MIRWAASLLFSVAITSSEIGQFFKLPDWMPNTVNEHDTPGSDTDVGWYVYEESTNWVERFTPFSCKCSYQYWNPEEMKYDSVQEDVSGKPVWDSSGSGSWNVSSVGMPTEHITVREFELYGEPYGSKSSTNLVWDGMAEALVIEHGYEDNVHLEFNAVRERYLEPIVTTKWVPRAARATTNILAGVMSTFDGFYERIYFAMEGQSNVWNVAEWGPRNNRTNFWFNVNSNPHEYDFADGCRTNVTRRFVYWPEVDDLASYFFSYWKYGNRFAVMLENRPNWCASGGDYDNSSWFSSSCEALYSDRIFPSTGGWVSAETLKSANWYNCCKSFACLTNTASVWVGESSDASYPLYDLMWDMAFGFGDMEQLHAGKVDKSLPDVLLASFPHSDPYAITNATKRLYSDRLCCMNQVMSLWDVTLYTPQIEYPPSTTVVKSLRTSQTGAGRANAVYDFRADGVYAVINRGSVFDMSAGPSTNMVQTYESVSPITDARYTYMQGTSTELSASVGSSMMCAEIDQSFIRMAVGGKIGRFQIFFYNQQVEPNPGAPVDVYDTSAGTIERAYMPFGLSGTGCVVNVSCGINRTYLYERMKDDRMRVLATQPGREGLSSGRAVSSEAGTICGVRYTRTDTPSHTIPTEAGSREYRTWEESYVDHADVQNILDAKANLAHAKILSVYGFNVDSNPWLPISIPSGTIESLAPKISGESKITFYGGDSGREGLVYYIVECESDGEGTVVIDPSTPLPCPYVNMIVNDTLSITNPPSITETQPLIAEDKTRIMTRTEWQWKSLKRDSH